MNRYKIKWYEEVDTFNITEGTSTVRVATLTDAIRKVCERYIISSNAILNIELIGIEGGN